MIKRVTRYKIELGMLTALLYCLCDFRINGLVVLPFTTYFIAWAITRR